MPAQAFVSTTTDELARRIDIAHDRFAELVARVDGDTTVGGTWTARDVAAHVLTVVNRYNDFAPHRLADDPRGVDTINQHEVDAQAGRSTVDLLSELSSEMGRFRTVWGPQSDFPLDMDMPFHGGATIDLQSGLTNLVGEFLIHGLDVAVATGQPWEIEDRDGALMVAFGTQILPYYVRADNDSSLLVHLVHLVLEGVDPWALDVAGATATSRKPTSGDDPDVIVQGLALPVALLFYGRVDLAGEKERGLQVVGGRDPRRAAELITLFEEP